MCHEELICGNIVLAELGADIGLREASPDLVPVA